MDGPPAEFATAFGRATFTPCGDRRWRVAFDDTHAGELFEEFSESPGDPSTWGSDAGDGLVHPWRNDWMSALADLSRPAGSRG